MVHTPRTKRGGPKAASVSYASAPVWPSGDWLPPGRIERATQIGGWFGLASDWFPLEGVIKHQARAVQKLAVEAEPPAAFPASVLPVPADRMADGREVGADLVGASGLEPDAQERGAWQALHQLEMGDRPARAIGTRRDRGPVEAVAAEGRIHRAALG